MVSFDVFIVLLKRGESFIGSVSSAFASRCIQVWDVSVCMTALVLLGGEDARLDGVGQWWLDIPVWVSVLGVHV